MFPDQGHGPCSDCQRDPFDPWDIVAVPVFWALMAGYALRDFIWPPDRPMTRWNWNGRRDG